MGTEVICFVLIFYFFKGGRKTMGLRTCPVFLHTDDGDGRSRGRKDCR